MCLVNEKSELNYSKINSTIHKKIKIRDAILHFNEKLIYSKLLNNENGESFIKKCKCKKYFHHNCFLIFIVYTGEMKCIKCMEYYQIKCDNFISINEKLVKENCSTIFFYIFFVIIIMISILILFLIKYEEQYKHIKFTFSFMISLIGIFALTFLIKKIKKISKYKIPENLLFLNDENKIDNNNDYIKLSNKTGRSKIYLLDLNKNSNIDNHYFNLNNILKSNFYNNITKRMNINIPNNYDFSSITNSKHPILQNNFLNLGPINNNILNSNKLGINFYNNANIKNQINENDHILINRSVLDSLQNFTNFNNFFFNRSIYDIYELKANYFLNHKIILEKENRNKSTFDELKILENEIFIEKENRLAIENFNKNIFNFDFKSKNNKEKNISVNFNTNKILVNTKNGGDNMTLIKNFNNNQLTLKNNPHNYIFHKSPVKYQKEPFLPIFENLEEDEKTKINGKRKETLLKEPIGIKIETKMNENLPKTIIFNNNNDNFSQNNNNIKSRNLSSHSEINSYFEEKNHFPVKEFSTNELMEGFERNRKKLFLFEENEVINNREYMVIKDKNPLISSNNMLNMNDEKQKDSEITYKKDTFNRDKNKYSNMNNINRNLSNQKKDYQLINPINKNNKINNFLLEKKKLSKRQGKRFDKSLESIILHENQYNESNQKEILKMPKNIFEADNNKIKINPNCIEAKKIIKNVNRRSSLFKNSIFSQDSKDSYLNQKDSDLKKDSKILKGLGTNISVEKITKNCFESELNIEEELRKHNIDLSLFDRGIQSKKKNFNIICEKSKLGNILEKKFNIPIENRNKFEKLLNVNKYINTFDFYKEFEEKEEFSIKENSVQEENNDIEFDYNQFDFEDQYVRYSLPNKNKKIKKETAIRKSETLNNEEEIKTVEKNNDFKDSIITKLNNGNSISLTSSEDDSIFFSNFTSNRSNFD